MRQKLISTVSKLTFLAVIVFFGVGFVYWECSTLNDLKTGKQTLVSGMILGSVDRVTVGGKSSEEVDVSVDSVVMADDARPLIIRRYLERYKSPLADYADLIFELSETYGFEYYWIPAIAQQESNLCKKIPEGSHNCWGYGIHSKGTLGFDSYPIALKSFAEYLTREYFDKGLNTAELMMTKYCPHSNGSWAFGINQFIDEMETGDF